MFTCPNKDLHSLYLDGEMPKEYLAEYEAHVEKCPECQAQLKRLRALNALFAADSEALALSDKDKEDSFARLQARMSYARVMKPVVQKPRKRTVFRDVMVGAAAAAVVAIILPARLGMNPVAPEMAVNAQQASFQPVARTTSFSLPTSVVLSDGDVNPVSIAAFLKDDENSDVSSSRIQAHDSLAAAVMPFGTPVVAPAATTATANLKHADEKFSLASYDVFSPIATVEEEPQPVQKDGGFHFSFHSALFSLDIGKGE